MALKKRSLSPSTSKNKLWKTWSKKLQSPKTKNCTIRKSRKTASYLCPTKTLRRKSCRSKQIQRIRTKGNRTTVTWQAASRVKVRAAPQTTLTSTWRESLKSSKPRSSKKAPLSSAHSLDLLASATKTKKVILNRCWTSKKWTAKSWTTKTL